MESGVFGMTTHGVVWEVTWWMELFNVFVSIITGATSSFVALNILELMTSFIL